MARPHALIFDMDGLLLDTEGLYKRAWAQAAAEPGFDLTDAIFLKLIGITVADAHQVLAETFGPKFPLDTFRVRSAELYENLHETEGVPLKGGAYDLLAWARQNKIPCAVGTSTVTEEAEKRLRKQNILEFFQCVVGGDQVQRGKPNPDIFLKAQASLGVEPANCLVLEDAHSGLLAAKAGGMRAVMVPDMLPATEESRAIAEGVFPSLLAVRDWIDAGCPAQSARVGS